MLFLGLSLLALPFQGGQRILEQSYLATYSISEAPHSLKLRKNRQLLKATNVHLCYYVLPVSCRCTFCHSSYRY